MIIAFDKNPTGGIANICEDGTIKQCALGAFEAFKNGPCLTHRIAAKITLASKLEGNVVLDSHLGESDSNGQEGKSLSAVLFTQHYFEHSLGWDFTNVWKWDKEKNQPELRTVGVNAAPQRLLSAESQSNITDLLQQQLKANLWL